MEANVVSPREVPVVAAHDCDRERAQALAAHLGSVALFGKEAAGAQGLRLVIDEGGLALSDGELSMRGDFTRMLPRIKQGAVQREYLVRAAKVKGIEGTPRLADATAGLGEDSLLLAAAGFDVELFELNPVVAALLRNALERAALVPELSAIVARMHLTEGDSTAALSGLGCTPDVVLLDPMFPARQKSALVKKKFQLIHHLECPCQNEAELLEAALAANPRKVVIKRPPKGPYLAGKKPSYSLEGKAVRYDCIVVR